MVVQAREGFWHLPRAKHRGLYSLNSQGSALTHLTATGSTAVLLHASVSALSSEGFPLLSLSQASG